MGGGKSLKLSEEGFSPTSFLDAEVNRYFKPLEKSAGGVFFASFLGRARNEGKNKSPLNPLY